MKSIGNPISDDEYKKKIIVFLDVLGMTEFSANPKNEAKLKRFYSIVRNMERNYIKAMMQPITFSSRELGYKFETDHAITTNLGNIESLDYNFSVLGDAFVFSFNHRDLLFLNSLTRVIRLIYFISMTELGLICRGAISIGQLFHDKDSQVLFGEALGRAAAIEKSEKLPRIVIDKKIVTRIQNITTNDSKLQALVNDYKAREVIIEVGGNVADLVTAKSLNSYILEEDGDSVVNIFNDLDYTTDQIGKSLVKTSNQMNLISITDKTITEIKKSLKKNPTGKTLEELNKKLGKWNYILSSIQSS